MIKQKSKKMLKRKKDEGIVAYFKRWSKKGIDITNPPAPGCRPLVVSASLYKKIKEALK
jgi:hypothetical protein